MNNNDVKFVHNLYGQSNEKPELKIDLMFTFITVFVLICIIWATIAEVDELTRGEGKVIPSSKIQSILLLSFL